LNVNTLTFVEPSPASQATALKSGKRRSDLFILSGVPEHIRSDNGPEFIAKAMQDWIAAVGAKTAYIAPGRPGIVDGKTM
jgi:transposase InsO family protein